MPDDSPRTPLAQSPPPPESDDLIAASHFEARKGRMIIRGLSLFTAHRRPDLVLTRISALFAERGPNHDPMRSVPLRTLKMCSASYIFVISQLVRDSSCFRHLAIATTRMNNRGLRS